MNSESIGNLPWRQRGAALLVTLIILVLLTTAILLDRLNAVATPAPFGDRKSGETLARAKDALIAWAAAHPDHPGLLPFPDRNDDATPNYDGTADCVSAVSLASGDLLGRFPIQGEQTGAGLPLRIAAVIIAPGPALTGQDRSSIDSNPAIEYPKHLESVTIGPDTFNWSYSSEKNSDTNAFTVGVDDHVVPTVDDVDQIRAVPP